MSAALLREMFEQMVIAKDPEAIGRYYHPHFVMYSDGLSQTFAEFEEQARANLTMELTELGEPGIPFAPRPI